MKMLKPFYWNSWSVQQLLLPERYPQWSKIKPLFGVAVRVTFAPEANAPFAGEIVPSPEVTDVLREYIWYHLETVQYS